MSSSISGQHVHLRIESLAHGGAGVAHHEGMAIFVPGTVPSDLVEAEITEIARRFARARLLSVVEPSPSRVAPQCAHFSECGGCDWQMMDYAAQLKAKTEIVRDCLVRIGRFPDPPLLDILPAPQVWRYRNKAEFAVGEFAGRKVVGYLRPGSHQALPISECALQHPINIKLLHTMQELLACPGAPALVQVIGRVSFATNQALAILVTPGEIAELHSLLEPLCTRLPELVGVLGATTKRRPLPYRSRAASLWGRTWLLEQVGAWQFRVSADSFLQINSPQNLCLLETVIAESTVPAKPVMLDGYCGVGMFTVPLGANSKTIHAVEANEVTLHDLRHNLDRYRLHHAHPWSGRVERILPRLADRGVRAQVLVLDPPRSGCGNVALIAAVRLDPQRIIMISCDPATLARDLRLLSDLGYELEKVIPVDLFPQTWHVECVAACKRAVGDP